MCGDNTINFRIEEANDEKVAEENLGVIVVKCIDSDGGGEIDKQKRYSGLSWGDYMYICPIVEGYDLVGPQSRSITLSEEEKQKTIVLSYTKILVEGTVTVKYIDNETDLYVAPERVYSHLPLGEYFYRADRVYGYSVVGQGRVIVSLTEEDPHSVVIFLYKKNM